MTIYDFNESSSLDEWQVINDGVMGGMSKGRLEISSEGHAVFKGDISLENNGGFSSVRFRMSEKDVTEYSQIVVVLKGDGKDYQLRLKSSQKEPQSYVSEFNTTGKWESITRSLSDFQARFRGRILDIPNFPSEVLEELAFLIANKKEEQFKLEIDKIYLQ